MSSGWGPGEKPPAQYLNWYQNGVDKWIEYFDNILNGDAFNGGQAEKPVPLTGGTYVNCAASNAQVLASGSSWTFETAILDIPVGAQVTNFSVVGHKQTTSTGSLGTYTAYGYYPNSTIATPLPSPVFLFQQQTPSPTPIQAAGTYGATYGLPSHVMATGERAFISFSGTDASDAVYALAIFWSFP